MVSILMVVLYIISMVGSIAAYGCHNDSVFLLCVFMQAFGAVFFFIKGKIHY